MSETKYRITDVYGCILAENMSLEMAIAFIRGFSITFFNERMSLNIEEMPRTEVEGNDI